MFRLDFNERGKVDLHFFMLEVSTCLLYTYLTLYRYVNFRLRIKGFNN